MLCLDATISGEGVFLAFDALAADAVTMGRLVESFRGRHATSLAYWFVNSPEEPIRRAASAFIDWLKKEMTSAGLGQTRLPT